MGDGLMAKAILSPQGISCRGQHQAENMVIRREQNLRGIWRMSICWSLEEVRRIS